MQEIRQQYQVVAAAVFDIKSTAFKRAVAITDASVASVLFCDFQHGRPIQRHDLGQRIVFRKGNAEQTMSGGDIQNLQFSIRLLVYQFVDQLRRHCHHRRHCARKFDPDRVFRTDYAVLRDYSAAFSDRRGQVLEAVRQHRRKNEVNYAAEICR